MPHSTVAEPDGVTMEQAFTTDCGEQRVCGDRSDETTVRDKITGSFTTNPAAKVVKPEACAAYRRIMPMSPVLRQSF